MSIVPAAIWEAQKQAYKTMSTDAILRRSAYSTENISHLQETDQTITKTIPPGLIMMENVKESR
jgi:hypothetical protein